MKDFPAVVNDKHTTTYGYQKGNILAHETNIILLQFMVLATVYGSCCSLWFLLQFMVLAAVYGSCCSLKYEYNNVWLSTGKY